MKKLTFTLALLLACIQFSQAQLLPSIEFGLKGALNFTSLKSDGAYFSTKDKAGYQAGAYARVGVLGFHVQPEIYVTGKNLEADFDNVKGGSIKYTSVDIPVLIGKRFGIGPLGARINTGPVFALNFNEKTDFKKVDDIKKSNTAWAFGAGADIFKLRVDLRYELGLSDINKGATDARKLNLWSIGVGYRLF